MTYGYLKVEYADDRPVYITDENNIEVTGKTNRLIRLKVGTYTVRLRDPKNYTPKYRRPTVRKSGKTKPKVVSFEKNPVKIFVSYSHRDSEWLNRFVTMIAPMVHEETLEIWSDKLIKPGRDWRKEIKTALNTSQAAVLLVSSHFLASEFIRKRELPKIINGVDNKDLTVSWIYVGYCMWNRTEIEKYQAAHDVDVPLEDLPPGKQNAQLLKAANNIDDAVS